MTQSLREILESHTHGSNSEVESMVALILELPEFRANKANFDLRVEYESALASQGLPLGTPIELFVQHHRGNAGMAVALQELGKQFLAQREQMKIDAKLVVEAFEANPNVTSETLVSLLLNQNPTGVQG